MGRESAPAGLSDIIPDLYEWTIHSQRAQVPSGDFQHGGRPEKSHRYAQGRHRFGASRARLSLLWPAWSRQDELRPYFRPHHQLPQPDPRRRGMR